MTQQISKVLFLAVALTIPACLPAYNGATTSPATYIEVVPSARPSTNQQQDKARKSRQRTTTMLGLGLLGAAVGAGLGWAMEADDSNLSGEAQAARTTEGALLGAGLGVVLGAVTAR